MAHWTPDEVREACDTIDRVVHNCLGDGRLTLVQGESVYHLTNAARTLATREGYTPEELDAAGTLVEIAQGWTPIGDFEP